MSLHAISPFSYSESETPEGYVCDDCGAKGVRLYMDAYTSLENQVLRCRACAIAKEKPSLEKPFHSESEHSIGWLVAAVPTEDGSTFWGFTSVPDEGVQWWNGLPKGKNA